MPANRKLPQVRLHASGNWCLQLSGQVRYLGRIESEARAKGDQLLAAWLARGRRPKPPAQAEAAGLTVAELCLTYLEKEGPRLGESEREYVQLVIRRLDALFGALPAARFGPKAQRAFAESIAAEGRARGYC